MNKIEWAFSTILTYVLILTAIKFTDPGLLNHITEPQIAVVTGITIALIQIIKQTTKLER
jgi:hypothetical protein